MKPFASIIALALALTPAYAFASPSGEDAAKPTPKTEERAHSAKKDHGKRQHAKATPKGRARAQGPAVVPVSNRTPKATVKESKPAGHKKTEKADKKGDSKHPAGHASGEHDHVEPAHTPAFGDKHDKHEAPLSASIKAGEHHDHDHGHVAPKKEHDAKPGQKVRLDEKPSVKPSGRKDGVKDEAPKAEPKSKDSKKPQKRPPCLRSVVEVARGVEVDRFALATCDGGVAPLAVEHLSVMLRPGSSPRPDGSVEKLAKEREAQDELAPHVRKIDPRLVSRLAQVAEHFGKDKPVRISVISGYRPQSTGSQHSLARAVDFRVDGVDNTKLVELCKTFVDTGCGYYPNSSFVHMDVRDPGTGHVSWIDASGPGETPRYVASWPPPGGHAQPAAAPALPAPEGPEAKGDPAAEN
ncbi:MAG: DUF882 domain-containing protein [Myxococcales bacterium]|nr:DUF882 domain-containing protein [Myxococcales bacterium]